VSKNLDSPKINNKYTLHCRLIFPKKFSKKLLAKKSTNFSSRKNLTRPKFFVDKNHQDEKSFAKVFGRRNELAIGVIFAYSRGDDCFLMGGRVIYGKEIFALQRVLNRLS
jgi:hypothetical protein